ncbi:tRNA threonylcarbamoyladenosine dehydratase [Feifania hominis]|uniref:tRNA threonylcarbamoyladenosine dehydratase n=1 Tax=Feifania hominis TaxID=2763660 RepID=A0A926DD32_9FIRM|nr:tRNA threonylcarbamoyladenosine dehydratase [Feifania hominis]MBC8535981.1 tRNA threonylcarbamoyladenosine dehydratase [Feifania hominis]
MFSRTELVLGREALERLSQSHVAVFGVGGVGGYVAEGLARAGVGELTLVDYDTVAESNRNRQLAALGSTVGRYKAEVLGERILDINPGAKVHTVLQFVGPENVASLLPAALDYAVDAIDTVSSKLLLIETAAARGIPILSSMGTGNKLDPTKFRITTIDKTSVCPLARVMRRELVRRGLGKTKVLFSTEQPTGRTVQQDGTRKATPGSVSWVPSCAGLMIAGAVVMELINKA